MKRVFGPRTYSYVVDQLTEKNAPFIKKSLDALSHVSAVSVEPKRNMVRVKARKDVTEQVKMACELARAQFRTKVK
jgi:hypothetical protein